jgi:hypothetical protein
VAPHGEGIGDKPVTAGFHPGNQVFLFAHTHGDVLLSTAAKALCSFPFSGHFTIVWPGL